MVSGDLQFWSYKFITFLSGYYEYYISYYLSFFDFFHLQLQYDIHVFSRDTYPTQKQYYTYSDSGRAAAWRFNQLDYCVLPCKAIYWSFTVPREIP